MRAIVRLFLTFAFENLIPNDIWSILLSDVCAVPTCKMFEGNLMAVCRCLASKSSMMDLHTVPLFG